MFDMLFGWRKASKCKRLIRKVQCRLKLLKNKRCTIVRQLRDDIAQLLKQGHVQAAFDRVEQVFKDENLVAVYDLLDQFCEFIIINLPYIRRNKDCPNDINEAASTIIYVSARLGELPELRVLRKLFGERYGQRFANVALQLLPGHLVNRQMHEKVCLKNVPDEAKSRLVSEIARSNFQSEPLLIEYSSETQQRLATKSADASLSIATIPSENIDQKPGVLDINNGEKESVYFDLSFEAKRLLKHLTYSFLRSKIVYPLIGMKTDRCNSVDGMESSVLQKGELQVSSVQNSKLLELEIPCLERAEDSIVNGNPSVKSCSESSVNVQEETVLLDDIQEFKSLTKAEGDLQDQRIFMFSPSAVSKISHVNNAEVHQGPEDTYESDNESDDSRSFKKSPKASGKRLRKLKRSVSIDITNVKDVECAEYYGESSANITHYGPKLREKRKHQKKIPMKQEPKPYHVHKSPNISFSIINSRDEMQRAPCRRISKNANSSSCSLEHPCYFCTSDETDDTCHSPTIPTIQCTICYHQCSCNKQPDIQIAKRIYPQRASMKNGDAKTEGRHQTKSESKPSYIRSETMPVERPNESNIDSYLRSNSFPVEQPGQSPLNPHVHPKLPDYDELSAKFTALKKANSQNHTPQSQRKIK